MKIKVPKCLYCNKKTIPITLECGDKIGVIHGWICNCESINNKLEEERSKYFLIQLHQLLENGETNFISQIEVNGKNVNISIENEIKRQNILNPLPEKAQWMVCEEGSKYFGEKNVYEREKNG